MRFVHRIVFDSSVEVQAELAAFGIAVPSEGLQVFEVEEGHPAWPAVHDWVVRRGARDSLSTHFSPQEVAGARWLQVEPEWHCGYPQPDEGHFGYLRATYDLSQWCDTCGMGSRQVAPFQMKREPKWGRRSILQLNWVFDVYFVTPTLWSTVFKPFGIESRAVLSSKGVELSTVVQLVVQSHVSIETEGLRFERCAKCGRVKYLPVTRGSLPGPVQELPTPMVATAEEFGSGRKAYREIIINQELGRALLAHKARGAILQPVGLSLVSG